MPFELVGQRVTLENQIRGLAVVFGVRLPRGLSSGFAQRAMAAGHGIPGLDGAMRGLLAARAFLPKCAISTASPAATAAKLALV